MKYALKQLSHQVFGCGSYAYKDTQSQDGQIYLPIDDAHFALYSNDSGKSWKTLPLAQGRKTDRFIQLQDGSFYALSFDNVVHDAIRSFDQENIPFVAGIYRAKSMEDVCAGNVSSSFTQIQIPRLSVGFGDSNNSHTSCISNGLIQLSNGDILATMYGQTKDDTTLCPYFRENGGYDFYLYRSWCILSKDGGNTFSFLSTIADVQTYPIPDVNAEGYCEPDIIEIEPGHIVCVIRTGGHEVYSPLYCTHSYDSGRTWEAPYPICSWGVLPKLFTMTDGTLVCVSGHIHTMLLFSSDKGRTWSEPQIIEPCDGKWGNSPSGYNTAFESSPGEITIVYDDPKEGIQEGASEGQLRRIYVRTYSVERENEA